MPHYVGPARCQLSATPCGARGVIVTRRWEDVDCSLCLLRHPQKWMRQKARAMLVDAGLLPFSRDPVHVEAWLDGRVG